MKQPIFTHSQAQLKYASAAVNRLSWAYHYLRAGTVRQPQGAIPFIPVQWETAQSILICRMSFEDQALLCYLMMSFRWVFFSLCKSQQSWFSRSSDLTLNCDSVADARHCITARKNVSHQKEKDIYAGGTSGLGCTKELTGWEAVFQARQWRHVTGNLTTTASETTADLLWILSLLIRSWDKVWAEG